MSRVLLAIEVAAWSRAQNRRRPLFGVNAAMCERLGQSSRDHGPPTSATAPETAVRTAQATDSSALRTVPRVSGLNIIATIMLTHPSVVPIIIGIANPSCQSDARKARPGP